MQIVRQDRVLMESADTCVIILNWNGLRHLETCLRALERQSYKRFRTILVDNGSKDGSREYVQKCFPGVEIISLLRNRGFAEGNNVGIREALADKGVAYIAVLNNDTEADAQWLYELRATASKDERIGAVSSKMLRFDERTVLDSAGDFFKAGTLKVVTRGFGREDKGQYDREEECFSARAGAALYRRSMLEDVELDGDFFDSHFFAYVEDTDLSVRARLKGWKIMYAPKAIVYHKVAATTSTISYAFRRYRSGRNRLFLAIKNYPLSLWLGVFRGTASVEKGYTLGIIGSIATYIRIACSLVCSLPRLVRQRRAIQQSRAVSAAAIGSWRERFSI
ncbi:MAG: glycosyltransferase family 2 protein [Patescibacteria group bacterium]